MNFAFGGGAFGLTIVILWKWFREIRVFSQRLVRGFGAIVAFKPLSPFRWHDWCAGRARGSTKRSIGGSVAVQSRDGFRVPNV